MFELNYREYRAICWNIAEIFAKKYFGKDAEIDWVADEVGEVCVIGDYFFSMDDMIAYQRYKYSGKRMFAHYEYALKQAAKGKPIINIKNYKKLKK